MSASGYTSAVKASCVPAGLHCGFSTSSGNDVSCFASPPSRRIVQICRDPERLLANAIVLLSGDHVGELSLRCLTVVSCRSLEPSALTNHKFVVVLFAS